MGRMVELVPGRSGRDGRVEMVSRVSMVGGRVGMARSLWSIGFSPPPRISHALKVPTRVERMPTSLGSQVAHCWCNADCGKADGLDAAGNTKVFFENV